MELTILESDPTSLRAGYSCPCGCTPSVTYHRGTEIAEEGCCCGNHFAIGPRATSSLVPAPGFRAEAQAFDAPWGEHLEAAWLVGPSVHGPSESHGHGGATATSAVDPVCGMTVDPAAAEAKGLRSTHREIAYHFCGKGCKLEFDDGPERYLDPGYVPSM